MGDLERPLWGVIFRPREPGGTWDIAHGGAGHALVFSDEAMARARAQTMAERYDKQLWHVIPMAPVDSGSRDFGLDADDPSTSGRSAEDG